MAEVRDVAKYLIGLSQESTHYAITPLKLQKLVYYAQGFYLRNNPEPLFKDDLVAWDHGPVNRALFDDYRHFKYLTIPSEPFTNTNGELKEHEKQVVDKVWKKFGHLNGKYLEELTHQEDPWLFTKKDCTIEIDLIKSYFESQPPLDD